MSDWKHSDCWKKRGKNFLVEVKHYTEESCIDYGEGQHRWNVYAYIYPKHKHFDSFTSNEMWQDAATMMPFHCGPSFLQKHESDGKVNSVQVGSDYRHHGDDKFSHYSTVTDAYEVFNDAQELFDWLEGQE